MVMTETPHKLSILFAAAMCCGAVEAAAPIASIDLAEYCVWGNFALDTLGGWGSTLRP